MKTAAFALLFVLVPLTAEAQSNPKRTLGKKLEWIGIGSLVGGAGIAAIGASRKETVTHFAPSGANNCTVSVFGAVTAVACVSVVATTPPSSPLAVPGTTSVSTPAATSTEERRAVNWKMVGPAIGVAGAGAFLTHLGHIRVKKAELSIQPSGGVQLAFKW